MKSEDIEQLCEKRVALIKELELGNLTKETFILENYRLMAGFKNVTTDIRTIEEGIIKYHYFNTQAKKCMIEAEEIVYRDSRQSEKLKNQAYDLYVKKDQVTLKMLEQMSFKHLEAYFIYMNSRHLEGQIYEIRCLDYEKVVLHSKDKKILHKLRTAGCFHENKMESIIQSYVNTRL